MKISPRQAARLYTTKNIWISLAAVAVLAGCAEPAPTVWVRPGATQHDFDVDIGKCRAQAWSVPNAGAAQLLIVQSSCMQGKGWAQQ